MPKALWHLIEVGAVTLIAACVYAAWSHLVSSPTLYDLTHLPPTDPRRLTYWVHPTPLIGRPVPFPSLFDPPEVNATFVVPASDYLSARVSAIIGALAEHRPDLQWEIIVACEPSQLCRVRSNPRVRILHQPREMGPGAAVQAGVLHARGAVIVAVDGSVGARDITAFVLDKLHFGKSSVLIGAPPMVTVGNFLTPFLNFLCEWITGTRSQIIACSRESARWIFPNMHMQDWGYVGEVLLLARERNLAICRFAIASPQSPLKIQLFPVVPIFAEFAATCVLHWVGLWRAIPRG